MKKYLLLLVMFIATIGYVAGLYGFFHNLNFIFHEITITPWLILRGMFPLAWGIMALLTFVMAEYVYRQRFRNEPHFRLKQIIWSKNLCFIGIVAVLIVRLIITSRLIGGQSSTLSSKEMIQLYLTMAAIGIAVVIFVRQQYTKIKHQRELRQYEKINILNGERRYTMMVIETNQDTICTGFVYGEMNVNDAICLHCSDKGDIGAKIVEIVCNDKSVNSARNQTVTIKLDHSCKGFLQKYSIISSIQYDANPTIVENPGLSGVLREYGKFFEDQEYIGTLVYEICMSEYYLIKYTAENEEDERFMSVRLNVDPSKSVLVLFTDWDALLRYSNILEEAELQLEVRNIKECFHLVPAKYDSIVINPFGPRSFIITKEFMRHIQEVPGYDELFKN
jgi:hypothetical protein